MTELSNCIVLGQKYHRKYCLGNIAYFLPYFSGVLVGHYYIY